MKKGDNYLRYLASRDVCPGRTDWQ